VDLTTRLASTVGKAREWVLGYPTDNPAEVDLPLQAIAGPFAFDGEKVRAWYRLYPDRWSYRSRSALEGVVRRHMLATAGLAQRDGGTTIVLRRMPVEMSVAAYGARYDSGPSDAPNRDAFARQLGRTLALMESEPHTRHVTYLGIEVSDRTLVNRALWAARHRTGEREQRLIADVLREIGESAGLLGRPCTGAEVAELVHRSVGLGLPTPVNPETGENYSGDALLTFTDGTVIDPNPGGPAVRVRGDAYRNGVPVERWVSVVGMGRVEEFEVPGGQYPWMAYADRLPFPVEWSAHMEIKSAADARAEIEDLTNVILDQWNQYRKHPGTTPPPDLLLADEAAKQVRRKMAEGKPLESTRVRGWVHAAIIGRTEQECLNNVARFRLHYKNVLAQFPRLPAQDAHVRSFVPGAEAVSRSHRRRMEVGFWAAAVPTIDAVLGDDTGHLMGFTDGTIKVPVLRDFHKPIVESEVTGDTAVFGALGSGKTTYVARAVYLDSHPGRGGNKWTVVDPSESFAGMVGLDAYRGGRAYLLDLMNTEDGAGSPFALIPEPKRENYDDDGTYWRAVKDARGRRKMLATDMMFWTLHPNEAKRLGAEQCLSDALAEIEGRPEQSVERDVIPRLLAMKGRHAEVAKRLLAYADHPAVRLYMGQGDPSANLLDYHLVVLKIAGFKMPDLRLDRTEWSPEERMNMLALLTGAHLAEKRIYELPMTEPKGWVQDEAHVLRQWSSGRLLQARISRDNRKFRLKAFRITHDPREFLEDGGADRIGEIIGGHLDDEATQAGACELMRIPRREGYEQRFGDLSPIDPRTNKRPPTRRFIHRDPQGNVETIRLDMSDMPELLAATSPRDKREQLRVVA
jgi:hypothetical protein